MSIRLATDEGSGIGEDFVTAIKGHREGGDVETDLVLRQSRVQRFWKLVVLVASHHRIGAGVVVLALAAYVTVEGIAQRQGYFAVDANPEGNVVIYKGQPSSLPARFTRRDLLPANVDQLDSRGSHSLASGATLKFESLNDAIRYFTHSVRVEKQDVAAGEVLTRCE